MDNKVIETCFSCNKNCIRFKKIKKENDCNIYLDVCTNCPFKSEFMILSGNEKSELPLNKDNIETIIDGMNKKNAYHVERTSVYINIFLDSSIRKTKVEKYFPLFDFLKFLDWSDSLKEYGRYMLKKNSEEFIKVLKSKRTGV